jgi:predicted DNA-binding transcriptional regulator YafY
MDRTERIGLLHGLLSSHRRGLSNERLMQEAGCSRTTLWRDLSHLRDALGAPLVHEGDPVRVWRYEHSDSSHFQLPGIWLSADELYALMLAQQVLQQSGGGLLGQALGPMQPRIEKLLGKRAARLDRLRVLRTQARKGNPTVFRLVTEAVLDG